MIERGDPTALAALDTAPEARPAAETDPPARPLWRRRLRSLIGAVILTLLLGVYLALGLGKLQLNKVISASMEPTLLIGDVILTDANALLQRYDVICMIDPESDPESSEPYVKRILGLPGDVISVYSGIVYINGQEEYSEQVASNVVHVSDRRVRVPEGYVFVMGDNRNNSYDSLDFGPVPYENILGVVRFIIWPPNRWQSPAKLH